MSAVDQLPTDTRERLMRFQQLQNTLQTLIVQRQQLELGLNETERALKALEGVEPEKRIYKSVGALLVEKDKDTVIKELSEKKELLEIRVKSMTTQEDKSRKRVLELQKSLQRELGVEKPPS